MMTPRWSRRSFFAALAATCVGRAASRDLERRLLESLGQLRIADTHEHFYEEKERLKRPTDFFSLAEAYVWADMVSAGLPAESSRIIRDQHASDAVRWRAFEPYWNLVRYTGYAQALRIAIRDLYGCDELSAPAVVALNDRIRSRNRPGLYKWILRDMARIRFLVEDDHCGGCVKVASTKENLAMFVLARRFDKFIIPSGRSDTRQLEAMTGLSISRLKDLEAAIAKSFDQNLAEGMRAVKVGLAYRRDLRFEETAQPDAERDFEAMMSGSRNVPTGFRSAMQRPFRRMEDYLFHHVLQLADAHRIPVQIHTGLFAGTGGVLTNSDPQLLINTFLLHPRVQFDIFHLGYPYQEALGVLAKSFPNVHLDFCWAHVVNPSAARRTLSEYLDSVPVNKILGFGGDYKHPELSYGHAKIARRNVAQALARKVEEGGCSEQEAFDIGSRILYGNAARLFSWNDAA
ncbi:MAG: amidohydrolase family protein [Bryobacterales bacterium]|nr:amidohydrolase family protein [Bryobacterales bacterium]